MERVVAEQLGHLSGHYLRDKFKSAYSVGHSTETGLPLVLNDLLCCADSGNLAVLLMLNLSAAFNTIDHTLLLERLYDSGGVTGVAIFGSDHTYMTGVSTFLLAKPRQTSTPLPCGLPQGSVLGPILFSLYTTLIGQLPQHEIPRQHFADD